MYLRILSFSFLIVFFTGFTNSQMTNDKVNSIFDMINELGIASSERVEEIQQTLLSGGEQVVPYLIRALESHPDSKVRYQVALILGNTRSLRGVKPLFIASQLDRSDTVREGAGLALHNLLLELEERRMEDTTYRENLKAGRGMAVALKRALKDDNDPAKRINAANALARLGKRSDIDDILKYMSNEKKPEVRISMLKAIEQIAYPEMLYGNYRMVYFNNIPVVMGTFRIQLTDSFLNIIEKDTDFDVKNAAIRSLTRLVFPIFVLGENRLTKAKGFADEHKLIIERVIENFLDYTMTANYRKIRPTLIESVTMLLTSYCRRNESGLDDEIRRRLTTEIFNFHGDYAYNKLPYTVRIKYERKFKYTPLKKSSLADKARKVFSYILLNDPEPENRLLSAKAFQTLGLKADANDIIKALQKEKEISVWLKGVEALGRIGDLSSSKWLYSLAINQNADIQLRIKAVLAIGQISNPEAIQALAGYYEKEKDDSIKMAILEAMQFRKDEKTANLLLKVLDDPDAEFRRAAVESLTENTYKPAITKLRELLKNDVNAFVRAAVIPSLRKNDPSNSSKDIIDALEDSSPIVRRSAVVELGIMKEKKASGKVAEIMRTDNDESVRIESARTLGYIGDQYSVQPLVDAIAYDESEGVWEEALRSLIMLERPRMGIVAIMNMMIEAQKKYPDAIPRLREAEYYLRLQWEGYLRRN